MDATYWVPATLSPCLETHGAEGTPTAIVPGARGTSPATRRNCYSSAILSLTESYAGRAPVRA
jgi:hypothetical protein